MATTKCSSILVVDEDVNFLLALRDVLTRFGYVATVAADATVALQRLNSPTDLFDAIIVELPLAGTGDNAFLTSIAARRPELPTIIISQSDGWHIYAEALHHGAFAYLSRPLEWEHLIGALRRALVIPPIAQVQRQDSRQAVIPKQVKKTPGLATVKAPSAPEFSQPAATAAQRASDSGRELGPTTSQLEAQPTRTLPP